MADYQGLLRQIYDEFLTAEKAKRDQEWLREHEGAPPKLFISSLGHCMRAAFFDAVKHIPDHPWHHEETHPFPPYVLSLLREGEKSEDNAEEFLRWRYGDRLETQVEVGNDIWSGRIDFFVKPDLVIEHKATNARNFLRKGGLPYDFHCLQVLAYRKFMEEKLGRAVWAKLLYRTHGHWAEFDVYEYDDGITWEGYVDGRERWGESPVSLEAEMRRFEEYWKREELPPRYATPNEAKFGCVRDTKQGFYPDCRYFNVCWPELPSEGPFQL